MRHSYHTSRRKAGPHKYTMIYYQDHRDILQAFRPNPAPGIYTCCDHIDGNTENHELSNLRWVTYQMNMLNIKKAKGWVKRGRSYYAHIKIDKQWTTLGTYDTPTAAHAVYDRYRSLSLRYIQAYWERHVADRRPDPASTKLSFNPIHIDPVTLTLQVTLQ